MSVGPLGGIVGSAAGAPLSQTKGASEQRAARDAVEREAADELDLRAEKNSGVGQAEEDSETTDRDADGRRLLERQQGGQQEAEEEETSEEPPSAEGDSGGHLDLIA